MIERSSTFAQLLVTLKTRWLADWKVRRASTFARLALALAVGCIADPFAAAAVSPADHPSSVILISIDTLRADRLSCYRAGVRPTPNIDEITQKGTLFSAVSSQVPLTLPSHTSLLTSTYPFSNGVEDNGEQVPEHSVTLAGILKSHGYHTAAFVGGFVLDRRFGLDQGFDLYDSPFDLNRQGGADIGDIKRQGGEVVDSAIQWLGKNPGDPFFVFLHLYDLHGPYDVPPAYRARWGAGYDAELHYVDDQIGRFWHFLAQRGLLKTSLVVFTADHGEGLGEHGESTHGYFIYQSTLWVPLIFHWPTDGAASFPSRIDTPAGLVDVAPTILQSIGIAPPSQFQGQSLLGLLHGQPSGENGVVYSESLYAHRHFDCSGLRSLRFGQYKYIDAPKRELYDLKQDPKEIHNLYAQKQSLAAAYRERLLSLASRFRAGNRAAARTLSPEAIARLSSLGYSSLASNHSTPIEAGADPKDRIAAYEEFDRAVQLGAVGRLAESSVLLGRLLTRYPHLTEPRISLGWNDQKLGDQAAAVKQFNMVVQDDPANAIAHFDLGVSYFKLGQAREAVKELQATLAIAPYYTRAENLLGTIYLQSGEYQQAEDRFRHILTVDPSDYGANYALGALAILNRSWDVARQHLGVALSVEPQNPAVHNTMGSYYLQRGELDDAQREFEQATQLQPKFAEAFYNLGLVFLQKSQNQMAASDFQKALAINPNLRGARAALDSLKPAGR